MTTEALSASRFVMLPIDTVKNLMDDPSSIIPYNWTIEKESILAALLIIFGVVIKTSEHQMKLPPTMIGPLMFVGGWFMLANAVARNATNPIGSPDQRWVPYLAAAVVVGAVMFMQQVSKKYSADSKVMMQKARPLVLAFIAGWLLFAYSFSQNLGLTFASAGLVFLSMLYFLPKQRAMNVVDGPGLPLFCIAFAGLIVANSTLLSRSVTS